MSPRNWRAVGAHFRRGGPMKHKNTPRGGASNQTRDFLEEYDELDHSEAGCLCPSTNHNPCCPLWRAPIQGD